MPRTLRAGDKGPDVLAMQQGLRKALGAKARNNGRGVYGSLTVHDVHLFKLDWSPKEADGHIFGANAWSHLEQYLGRRQKALLKKAQALEAARATESKEQQTRGLIVAQAIWSLAHRDAYVYAQYRPMPLSWTSPGATHQIDCSTSVTLDYKAAAATDPNGRGYDRYGYTGTLWNQGVAVATPAPTDLCFYGSMAGGVPSHVAICVELGWVVSFGHTPISKYPVRYRADYRGSRRYPVM
jgi:hypothetical protein